VVAVAAAAEVVAAVEVEVGVGHKSISQHRMPWLVEQLRSLGRGGGQLLS